MEPIKFSGIITEPHVTEDDKIIATWTQPREGEITLNNTSFNWSQTKIALKELLDVIQKNNLVEKRLEQKLVAGIQKKISKHEQYEYINKQMEMVKNNRQLFKNYFANHHYHSIALYVCTFK